MIKVVEEVDVTRVFVDNVTEYKLRACMVLGNDACMRRYVAQI